MWTLASTVLQWSLCLLFLLFLSQAGCTKGKKSSDDEDDVAGQVAGAPAATSPVAQSGQLEETGRIEISVDTAGEIEAAEDSPLSGLVIEASQTVVDQGITVGFVLLQNATATAFDLVVTGDQELSEAIWITLPSVITEGLDEASLASMELEFVGEDGSVAEFAAADVVRADGRIRVRIDTWGTIHGEVSDSPGPSPSPSPDDTPPGSPSISISSGADYATSTSVTLGLSATDAAEMYVTNTADCAGGGTWESYNTTKVWTLGPTDAVATVYVKYRDSLENETACVNDTITHDGTDPTEPGSVDDATTHDSESETPTISWVASSDANGIDHYELAIGTSAGGTQILDWTPVGNVTSKQITSGISLTDGVTYYASVRAVDSAGRTSAVGQGDGWTVSLPASCPADWVLVPANAAVGAATDFCVMKYEAKLEIDGVVQANGDNPSNSEIDLVATTGVYLDAGVVKRVGDNVIVKPVSSPTGKPWVYVERSGDDDLVGATELCDSLGPEYDLISNAQWQAIARNIENRASNWSGGTAVGDGDLNRGHSDVDPNNACDGSEAYVDTDCSNTGSEADYSQKRTHTLSNDEVIWDIAGNVWEWVSDDNSTDQGADTKVSLKEWDGIQDVDEDAAARLKWGPEGDYWSSHSSGEYGGLGHGYLNWSAGAVVRGGYWLDFTYSGVFAAHLNDGPSGSNGVIGFRCVRSP